MVNVEFLEVFKSSFTLVILVFCSLISIAFMIERWFYFRKTRTNADSLLTSIRKLVEDGNKDQALALCAAKDTPISRLFHYGLLQNGRSRSEIEDLLATKRLEERMKMEEYLGVLGTLGNTAPFIGLFGTVVGIIKAFRDLALSGMGGPTVVAKGIAEALVATAAGLAVAIPAVIAYNYFLKKVKNANVEMEVYTVRFLAMIKAK